jgi:hypothetical protein
MNSGSGSRRFGQQGRGVVEMPGIKAARARYLDKTVDRSQLSGENLPILG